MLAADTNVIVRLLVGDDPVQSPRARALFERETIFVPLTVLLETEWVLRSVYGFDPRRTLAAIEGLISLPSVICEAATVVADALRWTNGGLDFADALHLASARGTGGLATFDGKLAKQAAEIADVAVVLA